MTAADVTGWLDRLAETHKAATPGPWEVRWQCPEEAHHHGWDEGWIADPDGATVAVVLERYTSAPADAAAIVAAHNALPQLVAAVRGVLALADTWTRYPQSPEERERNRYGAAMQDCGDALRAAVAAALGAEVTGR